MDQGTRLQDFSAGFADTLRQAMHDVGFERLSFGLMEYIGEAGKQRGEQRVLYNTNSPAGWEERYLERRHFEIDPRIALQGDCGLPLAWDMPYLRERVGNSPGDPRVETFLADLARFDLHSGIVWGAPLRHQMTPRSTWIVFCSLSSSRPDRAWMNDTVMGGAMRIIVRACTHLEEARDSAQRNKEIATRASLPAHVLRRVIDFVEANVTQPISVRDMAEIADLSVHHFARSFKEASGRTPHQYVTERRLQLASRLLTETRMSILEIATAVGFESASHFAVVFRRRQGLSPNDFRRQRVAFSHVAASLAESG